VARFRTTRPQPKDRPEEIRQNGEDEAVDKMAYAGVISIRPTVGGIWRPVSPEDVMVSRTGSALDEHNTARYQHRDG